MNETMLDEAKVYQTLRQVMDPELGCDIVDLGLIYDVRIEGAEVNVRMTLTTKGCPMHQSVVHGVRLALLKIEEVEEAHVELVWDPPWTPSMMSEAGRRRMGIAC